MYEADVTESLDMKWYEATQREAALRGPGESEEEEDYSESASASEESSETAASAEWVSESGEESVESMEEEPAAEPPQPAQHQHHDRVAECQAFCRNAVFDAQLTTHEMANMHCAVEDYAQARARFLAHPFHYTDERWLERNVHPAPERAASGDESSARSASLRSTWRRVGAAAAAAWAKTGASRYSTSTWRTACTSPTL